MNKRHYEHTLPNIRGSLSNTYKTTCLCRKIARNKEREKEVIPAFELSTWHERKPSVNLYGWNEIKMYHKKELLQ